MMREIFSRRTQFPKKYNFQRIPGAMKEKKVLSSANSQTAKPPGGVENSKGKKKVMPLLTVSSAFSTPLCKEQSVR
jgi:hypothetical protein